MSMCSRFLFGRCVANLFAVIPFSCSCFVGGVSAVGCLCPTLMILLFLLFGTYKLIDMNCWNPCHAPTCAYGEKNHIVPWGKWNSGRPVCRFCLASTCTFGVQMGWCTNHVVIWLSQNLGQIATFNKNNSEIC